MEVTPLLILIPLAYLLGSIPTALMAGKYFHHIDIRDYGSGNAGATNAIRVLGWKTGAPVMLFDLGKGWLAASVPWLTGFFEAGAPQTLNIQMITGIVAVLGHVFPVFAGFRGGKGVATSLGFLLGIHPLASLLSTGVFLLVLFPSRYVSLSSIAASISFPLWVIMVLSSPSVLFSVFSCLIPILIIITHRQNIRRLWLGKENKAYFSRRKKTA
jgi:acyl phosphate:glycerol-3-phosphate acyltransferase